MRGRQARAWGREEIRLFRREYPYRGKQYFVALFSRKEGDIRHMAAKLSLRLDPKSEFVMAAKFKAGVTRRGVPRPAQSASIRRAIIEGRMNHLWRERTESRSAAGRKAAVTRKANSQVAPLK